MDFTLSPFVFGFAISAIVSIVLFKRWQAIVPENESLKEQLRMAKIDIANLKTECGAWKTSNEQLEEALTARTKQYDNAMQAIEYLKSDVEELQNTIEELQTKKQKRDKKEKTEKKPRSTYEKMLKRQFNEVPTPNQVETDATGLIKFNYNYGGAVNNITIKKSKNIAYLVSLGKHHETLYKAMYLDMCNKYLPVAESK